MSDLRDYVPPGPGEPLDAVQHALLRMWVGIISRRIRKQLAEEQRQAESTRPVAELPAWGEEPPSMRAQCPTT